MRVMFFDHPPISMIEILRNDDHGHIVHHAQARVGVTQAVKPYRRYSGTLTGLGHRPRLMRCFPAGEHQTGLSRDMALEKIGTLIAQDNVALLTRFGAADMERARVGVEVAGFQSQQLAIATTGL